MLNKAREKLSESSKSINFLEPLPTQQLNPKICQKADVITAIQSHHYLSQDERKKAVKSCYDLLNENGIFITFENIRPATNKGIEIGKNNWKSFQLSHGRDDETVKNHLQRFDNEYFPITIEDHLKLLKNAGFKVVELFWFSYMQAGFYCIK
jgi:tRNA (cmo5U34)-methyltransferase